MSVGWRNVIGLTVYLGNRLVSNYVEKKTPFEIIFNRKPDVSNLVLYGSQCFVRVPDEKRSDK